MYGRTWRSLEEGQQVRDTGWYSRRVNKIGLCQSGEEMRRNLTHIYKTCITGSEEKNCLAPLSVRK